MNPDQLFNAANLFVLIGWIILLFFPNWFNADKFILGIVITLLSVLYLLLIIKSFQPSDLAQFGSLAGIRQLFGNNYMLLAGWVHYLAFDLLTGLFISKNASRQGIAHWLVIPALVFTFLLGPVGLLIYLITRWVVSKNYFEDNF